MQPNTTTRSRAVADAEMVAAAIILFVLLATLTLSYASLGRTAREGSPAGQAALWAAAYNAAGGNVIDAANTAANADKVYLFGGETITGAEPGHYYYTGGRFTSNATTTWLLTDLGGSVAFSSEDSTGAPRYCVQVTVADAEPGKAGTAVVAEPVDDVGATPDGTCADN